ncbi:MAG: MBL fold metallo-hydrolase [Clostridia bacterium]|nr:MBL fold metallo-hydrolase [Clostridia bacterium]
MKRYSLMKLRKQKSFLISLILIFLLSLGVTISEYCGGVPWRGVSKTLGISDFSAQADSFNMAVHFIDVGKADSIYIKCNDKNILIDAGEKNTFNLVNEYLEKQNVKNLDLVIATHPHSDHIGGMPAIINEFNISKFIMPELNIEDISTAHSYEKLLRAIKSKSLNVEKPSPGSEFKLGDLTIQTLAPIKQYEGINNNSVVVKVTYKDQRFLFTGDAEKESEIDMISFNPDLSADVLKVGHHGSKTSSSSVFLAKVNPTYAVICVGEDRYNLPKKAIVDRLKNRGIKIFRTDINGTVILATNGEYITAFTEKEGA